MSFADLRAYTQAANEKVAEAQQFGHQASENEANALLASVQEAIEKTLEFISLSKEKYAQAHDQYAAITDHEQIQAAAYLTSQAQDQLDEAFSVFEALKYAVQTEVEKGREKIEDASNSGLQAIERGNVYMAGLPG